jgi:hypothetical protein
MTTPVLLSQLLILCGLVAATAEYCEVMKRRAVRRREEADQRAAQDAGLRGMVRLFIAER